MQKDSFPFSKSMNVFPIFFLLLESHDVTIHCLNRTSCDSPKKRADSRVFIVAALSSLLSFLFLLRSSRYSRVFITAALAFRVSSLLLFLFFISIAACIIWLPWLSLVLSFFLSHVAFTCLSWVFFFIFFNNVLRSFFIISLFN